MSQNNFMYEWKKAKAHYDTLADGSIQIHEDAPVIVKQSYAEYEKLMGKVNDFPKRKTSVFSLFNNSKNYSQKEKNTDCLKSEHVEHANNNIKAIFNVDDKKAVAQKILDQLPDWFGIEESKQTYINESANMPFWAYYVDKIPVGFIALKKHSNDSGEIYVMGILKEYHRQHIGSALLKESEAWCRSDGISYLQVKTVSDDVDDIYYAKTRAFYEASKFKVLEVFPMLWDIHNPCLLLIKKL